MERHKANLVAASLLVAPGSEWPGLGIDPVLYTAELCHEASRMGHLPAFIPVLKRKETHESEH